MVRGLEVFRKYFYDYSENYVIIGGTACDIILEDAALMPRATKDLDVVLVIEALTRNFVIQFWKFVKDGEYQQRQRSNNKKEYYRFLNPQNKSFPSQIEIFSRVPDILEIDEASYLTPIPVDEDLYSLSAILVNDDYYDFIVQNSYLLEGVRIANIEALICLKAQAFLDIQERIKNGSIEDNRHLKKHKLDIFRLSVMLKEDMSIRLPDTLNSNLMKFVELIGDDLPDQSFFKVLGLSKTKPELILQRFKQVFRLT